MERKMWRRTWNMQIKGKLKHFIWKCYHNILPIRNQLARRNIQVDQNCPMCGKGEEDPEPLLFKCGRAQIVWKLTPVKWDGLDKDFDRFSWWWQKLCTLSLDKVNQDKIQLSLYLIDAVENQKSLDLQWRDENRKKIVDLAIAEWQEFSEIKVVRHSQDLIQQMAESSKGKR